MMKQRGADDASRLFYHLRFKHMLSWVKSHLGLKVRHISFSSECLWSLQRINCFKIELMVKSKT